MNNVFQNNINALAGKDNVLAQKICDHVITDVPQLVKENGFYNLLYKGVCLHNKLNPLAEAQEIFAQAENNPAAIQLIYGLGLGYLFQVVSAGSQGAVILYEPDLNILKVAFTLVDFSKDIIKTNVYIADTLEKAGEYLYQKSNTKNTPLMLSTTAYRNLDEKNFNELVESLQRMVGQFGLDLKYTRQKFYSLLRFEIRNIPYLLKEKPLTAIKDFYKGKTAVVVSAGPTLDRNIEAIKKYRDRIVLLVVGTAMRTLAKHGITPDFLSIIETYDSSKQIEGLDLSGVNFITEPFSNTNVRKFEFKNTYSHVSANTPVNAFWSELAGVDMSEYFSKGTVSYTALNSARILGCSKIVLVGQDLAYIEGQCYSKDSAYKDLECRYSEQNKKWEITARDFDKFVDAISNSPDIEVRKKTAVNRLANLNSCLYYVRGIRGDMIPTESVYAAFIKPLTEFTEQFNDREYINTSLVGAQIDGFENMSLEEALADAPVIEDRNPVSDFKYDYNLIKSGLLNHIKSLNTALVRVNEGQKLVKNFKNELKRYKTLSVEVLKSLKKLSVNYLDLSSNYSLENKIFDFITTAERIDLDYEMKMTRELSAENVAKLSEKLGLYYDNAEKRINSVIKLIDTILGEIA